MGEQEDFGDVESFDMPDYHKSPEWAEMRDNLESVIDEACMQLVTEDFLEMIGADEEDEDFDEKISAATREMLQEIFESRWAKKSDPLDEALARLDSALDKLIESDQITEGFLGDLFDYATYDIPHHVRNAAVGAYNAVAPKVWELERNIKNLGKKGKASKKDLGDLPDEEGEGDVSSFRTPKKRKRPQVDDFTWDMLAHKAEKASFEPNPIADFERRVRADEVLVPGYFNPDDVYELGGWEKVYEIALAHL